MKIKDLIRLISRNWFLLLSVPLATAVSIYFFSKNRPEEYSSDTVIYTGVTSGFGIKDDNRADFYASSKAFSNLLTIINSRDTKQEVALRLLATHLMLKSHDPSLLSEDTYIRLKELINEPLRKKLVGSTVEETVQNLFLYLNSNSHNVIRQILDSEEPGYSIKAFSNLTAHQIGGSDLMKVEYISNDAAMCRHTLKILSEVFIQTHKNLLEGQNESVINYFQTATAKAAKRLEDAEHKLLQFHKTNNIINYDEQATNIANEKQNLLQRYNALEIKYAGAVAALKAVERNLGETSASLIYSQEIIKYRNQLSILNTQIAELEGFNIGKPDETSTAKVTLLKHKADETEARIKASTDSYYKKTNSIQGIQNKDMLNEWVKNAILVEELKGQLTVMRKQSDNFSSEYGKIAPLGANLRKIEREIEMAEKEYFSQLNGLSQSKITQQNIELTSRLKVVDPPFTPIKPNSSKKLLLLLLGTFGSFCVVLGGLIAAALLSTKMRDSDDANNQTGFPVLGVLPLLNSSKKKDQVKIKRSKEQLARQVLLKIHQNSKPQSLYTIGVMSSVSGEGKSTIISTLAEQLKTMGVNTITLFPEDHEKQITHDKNTSFYSPLEGLNQGVSFADISRKQISDYSVMIIEFPAVLESAYPVSLLQHLDMALVTIRANRSWLQADKNIFQSVQQVVTASMQIVLNGVSMDHLDEIAKIQFSKVEQEQKAESAQRAESWQGQTLLNAQ